MTSTVLPEDGKSKGGLWGFLIAVTLIGYVLSYQLLMIRNWPARQNGVIKFRSTFRWAPLGEPAGPLSIPTGTVTVFNYIYYPLDWAFYTVIQKDNRPKASSR